MEPGNGRERSKYLADHNVETYFIIPEEGKEQQFQSKRANPSNKELQLAGLIDKQGNALRSVRSFYPELVPIHGFLFFFKFVLILDVNFHVPSKRTWTNIWKRVSRRSTKRRGETNTVKSTRSFSRTQKWNKRFIDSMTHQ